MIKKNDNSNEVFRLYSQFEHDDIWTNWHISLSTREREKKSDLLMPNDRPCLRFWFLSRCTPETRRQTDIDARAIDRWRSALFQIRLMRILPRHMRARDGHIIRWQHRDPYATKEQKLLINISRWQECKMIRLLNPNVFFSLPLSFKERDEVKSTNWFNW
jgi:hypothetical protein